MDLLYIEEHLCCRHYQKNSPLIRSFSFEKGEKKEGISSNLSELIFLKEGCMSFSINEEKAKEVKGKEVFLLPPNSKYQFDILERACYVVIYFHVQINMCEKFSMAQLYDFCDKIVKPEIRTLPFNKQMSAYVDLLDYYVQDSINCSNLYELKKQEAFILLRAYYSKEQLAAFFYPILDKEDLFFRNFILEKCLSAKTVRDLADMANYSISGFEKKFMRCFNNSPYRWMMSYKADRILHEIEVAKKPLKEIYTEYNFSSMSHFINFCRKQYGTTPGKMRKEKKDENLI